jgi:3-hydroxyacyl-[acyl-carrier-protein] dehydratase
LVDILSLPHRLPFLFLDRIQEIVPGERGTFIIQWSSGGDYQSVQAPPSFSQALILEAMAEAAGLILLVEERRKGWQGSPRGYLLRLDRVSFDSWPRPGEEIRLSLTKKKRLGNMVLFSGEAYYENRLLGRADLTLWHGAGEEGIKSFETGIADSGA